MFNLYGAGEIFENFGLTSIFTDRIFMRIYEYIYNYDK